MKSLDKLPTPENLDQAAKNDVLDRNFFIFKLYSPLCLNRRELFHSYRRKMGGI